MYISHNRSAMKLLITAIVASSLSAAPAYATSKKKSGSNPKPGQFEIHKRGTIVLESGFWVDLDLGKASEKFLDGTGVFEREYADFVFSAYVDSNGKRWSGFGLAGEKTLISVGNNTPYEPEDCRSNTTSRKRIDLLRTPGGTWFCFKTSQGRFGQLRLSTVPVIGDQFGNLKVEYMTWER